MIPRGMDVNPKNRKFHRALETQQLIEALSKINNGCIMSYEELSVVAFGDVSHGGIKSNFLATARRILKKESGIEFKAINNVGLRRMTDSEKISKSAKVNENIVKRSKDGMASIASTNYHKLSKHDKVIFNTTMTVLNGHIKIGGADVVHKVQKAVEQKKQPLQLAQFAKMFNAKNHRS